MKKTDKLLASSIKQISLASESLDGPIKNEIEFLNVVQKLDSLVQDARDNFKQTLDID